jgi:hypothetical protein
MRPIKIIYPAIFLMLVLSSCYRWQGSSGGGQNVKADTRRSINTEDIALPDGYRIEAITTNLTFPTGAALDENGDLYVIEAGYSYGEVFKEPRLLKINPDGSTETVVTGENNGPWNGIEFHQGVFYIAEGGQLEGGRILAVKPDGSTTALVENLPSLGDHHTNGPAVHGNYLYFGQGVATNASVVGQDNYEFGWLKRFPEFHDIPCEDIVLNGINYASENIVSPDNAITGSFLPYGIKAEAGQVIEGRIPCSGAVMRIPLEGGNPELVAWGFRNPYGLAFSEEGELFVTDNGYDDRGSRPVWGTGDYLWKVEEGNWYGWPDYSGGRPIEYFKVPGGKAPEKVLREDPGQPPHSTALLGVHSSSNGFDFSTSEEFGFAGEAFIAQFGDMAPGVGKVMRPVGYKVVRVNTVTGVIQDFARNRKRNSPASRLKNGGLERPVSVKFSPDGRDLYIVDFGILLMSKQGPQPLEQTGVIWKVTREK